MTVPRRKTSHRPASPVAEDTFAGVRAAEDRNTAARYLGEGTAAA